MPQIIVDRHYLARSGEPPKGIVVSPSVEAPGNLDVVAWADGTRLLLRFTPEEATHMGVGLVQASVVAKMRGEAVPPPDLLGLNGKA